MTMIHNNINRSKHPKYNGDPFILLSICVITMVSMYNLGINKQQFEYRAYPVP